MSEKLDHLYEFAKRLGFTETGALWETTPSLEVMPDFRIFPNTVRDIKAEVDARIAELTAEMARLEDELRNEQHALRLADRVTLDLADECARYKIALDKVSARAEQGRHEEDFEAIANIARNALKDGV